MSKKFQIVNFFSWASMDNKLKIVIALVIVIVVVVAGVAVYLKGGLGSSTAKSTGNTITIASSVVPTSLDPAVAYDTGSVFFDDQIYQTLVGYGTSTFNGSKVGSLTPVPQLASSWTVNPNGSVLFNLTHNVTFANGDPFNSSAVKFTFDRIISMKQGPSFHVWAAMNASGVKVLGTYQVLMIPSSPDPWFLNLFQLWVTGIVDPLVVNPLLP